MGAPGTPEGKGSHPQTRRLSECHCCKVLKLMRKRWKKERKKETEGKSHGERKRKERGRR